MDWSWFVTPGSIGVSSHGGSVYSSAITQAYNIYKHLDIWMFMKFPKFYNKVFTFVGLTTIRT